MGDKKRRIYTIDVGTIKASEAVIKLTEAMLKYRDLMEINENTGIITYDDAFMGDIISTDIKNQKYLDAVKEWNEEKNKINKNGK